MKIGIVVSSPYEIIKSTIEEKKYESECLTFILSIQNKFHFEKIKQDYPNSNIITFPDNVLSKSVFSELLEKNDAFDLLVFQIRITDISSYKNILECIKSTDIPSKCVFFKTTAKENTFLISNMSRNKIDKLEKYPIFFSVTFSLLGMKKTDDFKIEKIIFLLIKRFLSFIFSPIILLFSTPFRFFQSFFNLFTVFGKGLKNFNRFNAHYGLISMLYWKNELLLSRFGMNDTCTYIGNGDFKMSRFFAYTRPSIFFYRKSTVLVPVFGMFGLLSSFFIWKNTTPINILVPIILITMFSTTFYANMFLLQSYHVIGWMFFPFGIYGLQNHNYTIAALAWFLCSFSSTTVLLIGAVLSLSASIYSHSLLPLYALIPAILKMSLHFIPFLSSPSKGIKHVFELFKALGMADKKTKYKVMSHKKLTWEFLYFFVLYIQFIIVLLAFSKSYDLLFITGFTLFLINYLLARFADYHNIHLALSTLAIASVLKNPNIPIAISLGIILFAHPYFLGFYIMNNNTIPVPVMKPFYVKNILDDLFDLFSPVEGGERVFMAFDYPKDIWGNIFDGFRILMAPVFYTTTLNKIHFIPDYSFVVQNNYEGAKELWGRDISSAIKNMDILNAKFLIIYEKFNDKPSDDWKSSGFQILKEFDWNKYRAQLSQINTCSKPLPKFFLLKRSS